MVASCFRRSKTRAGGEPDRKYYLRYVGDGRERTSTFSCAGEPLLDFPAARECRWQVLSSGLRPVSGVSRNLQRRAGERYSAVEFRLPSEPGWGQVIVVHDSHGESLKGVLVRFDDIVVGTTDETGSFLGDAREAPRAITVERTGWTIASQSAGLYKVHFTLTHE